MALNNLGNVPAGSVVPLFWTSHDAATGANETLSGLAATDIEVYKGVSMTQRSSDNGYALVDTDGIDVDSMTGVNAISIDLGDNTDAGFYAAGSFYNVFINAVTIDAQTVIIHLATFRIVTAESTAGLSEVTVNAVVAGAITAAAIAADAIGASELAADAVTEIQTGLSTLTQANIRTAVGLASANLDTQLSTIDDFLDTEVAAILAAVDTEVAAILALLDNARAEPGQGAPPVNPDMATKVDYLYKWARNKKDNDGTDNRFYADDASTIDHKQSVAESAGTVTVGEMRTGA